MRTSTAQRSRIDDKPKLATRFSHMYKQNCYLNGKWRYKVAQLLSNSHRNRETEEDRKEPTFVCSPTPTPAHCLFHALLEDQHQRYIYSNTCWLTFKLNDIWRKGFRAHNGAQVANEINFKKIHLDL